MAKIFPSNPFLLFFYSSPSLFVLCTDCRWIGERIDLLSNTVQFIFGSKLSKSKSLVNIDNVDAQRCTNCRKSRYAVNWDCSNTNQSITHCKYIAIIMEPFTAQIQKCVVDSGACVGLCACALRERTCRSHSWKQKHMQPIKWTKLRCACVCECAHHAHFVET